MNRIVRAGVMLVLMGAWVASGPAWAQAPATGKGSELVSALAKELGSTPKQAEGAAGSLFRLAKSRMTPEGFGRLAKAVPDLDQLLAAAPALEARGAGAQKLGQAVGADGLGGLAGVAQSFRKLGLNGDMVKKAVPVVRDYVAKVSDGDLAKLVGDSLR
jgi:hypothetical protein